MTRSRNASVSSRKQPRQARSTELVAAVLDAALQVLAQEGAGRFTTARVAEKAGVSVGSLYQYFPNKASILFRLQADEWRRTTAMLRVILEDGRTPAPARLRALVHAFIRSECEEAGMRIALSDAAPLYRDAPEAAEAKAAGKGIFRAFLRDGWPSIPASSLDLTDDLITATMSEVGKRFSEQPRVSTAIAAFADAMADMFCAYLASLERD